MPTECIQDSFEFGTVDGREVVGKFDGGVISSEAGALLLGQASRATGIVRQFAGCFSDARVPEAIEHSVETLVGQRIFGLALGYEDLNDHDQLRHDPVLAVLAGKLAAGRKNCAPLAGKSTLNRLELSRADHTTRYCKISHDPAAIERLPVSCSSMPSRRRAGPSSSISMRLIRSCTACRRGASTRASTTATAICRCSSSVVGICWPPSCAERASMRPTARSMRWPASSLRFASAGRRSRSGSGPTAGSAATI